MKTHLKVSLSSITLFTGLFFGLIACEDLEVDPDTLNPPDVKSSTIYARSGNSTLIDISAQINTSQAVNLTITSSPTKGNLSSLGSGILEYSPNQNVTNARDAFSYTLSNSKNEILKQDSIIIIVKNDSTALPAGIYPAMDIIYGVVRDVTISIDVLANDIISPYTVDDLIVSVLNPQDSLPPYFGSATVSGNIINYTANGNFQGGDKIIYKVEVKNDPTIFAYGLVYLSGTAACSFQLLNDSYFVDQPFTQIQIPVLDNDQLCNAINNYSITISKTPAQGKAYFQNNYIVYEPYQTAQIGFVDSLLYTITIDGISETAGVVFGVKPDGKPCGLIAESDFVDLTNSQLDSVFIDVLQNDLYCDTLINLEIEIGPSFGIASVVTNGNGAKKILYIPNKQQVADDKIIYRIQTSSESSLSGVAIKRVN